MAYICRKRDTGHGYTGIEIPIMAYIGKEILVTVFTGLEIPVMAHIEPEIPVSLESTQGWRYRSWPTYVGKEIPVTATPG
jgi:hypothetical protein